MTELATIADYELDDYLPRPAAPRPGIDLKRWADEFRDVYKVSEALAKTPFVPREMIGKTADVAAAIMKGRELGLDPFDALGSIYIVHGRVGYYAEFMRRRILQAGHKLKVVENTDSRCILEGIRKGDTEATRATFTAEQAKRAKINLGDYPADKLLARATSRLCRQVFPDVLAGSVIAEDIIDGLIPAGDDEPRPPAPQASVTAIARKRPTKKAEAAATQPPAAPTKPAMHDEELDELLADDTDVRTPDAQPAEAPPQPDDEPPLQLDDEPQEAEIVAEMVTPAQLKKLSILLREAGFDTPESKHGFTSTAIDREIGSAKELTKDEAIKVIGVLERGELAE